MSIIRKESVIKKQSGSTVYVQRNVQNNLTTNVNNFGYDSSFVNSVNVNTDLFHHTYKQVQQLSHESITMNQESNRRFNEYVKKTDNRIHELEIMIKKQNDIIQRHTELIGSESQMLAQQDQVEVVRSYSSKEMACTTILNLLFNTLL